jgi:hypothetical protein
MKKCLIPLANEMKKAIERMNNNFFTEKKEVKQWKGIRNQESKAIYFAFRCYYDQAERNLPIYISLIFMDFLIVHKK